MDYIKNARKFATKLGKINNALTTPSPDEIKKQFQNLITIYFSDICFDCITQKGTLDGNSLTALKEIVSSWLDTHNFLISKESSICPKNKNTQEYNSRLVLKFREALYPYLKKKKHNIFDNGLKYEFFIPNEKLKSNKIIDNILNRIIDKNSLNSLFSEEERNNNLEMVNKKYSLKDLIKILLQEIYIKKFIEIKSRDHKEIITKLIKHLCSLLKEHEKNIHNNNNDIISNAGLPILINVANDIVTKENFPDDAMKEMIEDIVISYYAKYKELPSKFSEIISLPNEKTQSKNFMESSQTQNKNTAKSQKSNSNINTKIAFGCSITLAGIGIGVLTGLTFFREPNSLVIEPEVFSEIFKNSIK